jgi:LPXTG-motif cell wall-anchored protein
VAHLIVRDANLTAVTLWNGDSQVPAEVSMADDQLEPDLRNFMTITPASALDEGTSYTIKIEPIITSKSGDVLEAPLELSFTTAASVAEEAEIISASQNNNSGNSLLIIAGIGVLVIVVAVLFFKRKKA